MLIGVLLLYAQGMWIGKIYLGLAGALFAIAGLYLFSLLPLLRTGLILIALALPLLLAEVLFQTFYIAAACAAPLLACGLARLVLAPRAIGAFAAASVSLVITVATLWIGYWTRKATLNKRSDL